MHAANRYQVRRNAGGRYEVCERGSAEPAASFDSEPEAREYARRLSSREDGGACATGETADSPVKDF